MDKDTAESLAYLERQNFSEEEVERLYNGAECVREPDGVEV